MPTANNECVENYGLLNAQNAIPCSGAIFDRVFNNPRRRKKSANLRVRYRFDAVFSTLVLSFRG
jgi:hypothetical protein